VVTELPQIQPRQQTFGTSSEEELRAALAAQMTTDQNRSFSLRQIREIQQVRALAPEIELDAVQFATGSAAIQPEQARSLARIGTALSEIIARDPRTVILVEGHTDAVGDATYNLALSDRRAETVALALTEYFRVPPENMITQGYGESALKIRTLDAEAANRRAVVRNITGLLR
jgi:outer membrane protein OmpA-like peptidoglycan-associated protein